MNDATLCRDIRSCGLDWAVWVRINSGLFGLSMGQSVGMKAN